MPLPNATPLINPDPTPLLKCTSFMSRCLPRFFHPQLKGENRRAVLKALKGLPPEDTQNLIYHASRIIDPFKNVQYRVDIINYLKKLPPDKVGHVVSASQFLFTPDKSYNVDFMKIFGGIENDEMPDFINQSLNLMSPLINTYDRFQIAQTFKDIPFEERDSVADSALELFTNDMDGWMGAVPTFNGLR